jgi:hypothetical protein
MRTGELYECVESPFSYSRSWGYTPSRILLYDGWLRHRLLNELFRSLKNSAFHRLSRSVNLEYYAFLVFSNLSNRNDSLSYYVHVPTNEIFISFASNDIIYARCKSTASVEHLLNLRGVMARFLPRSVATTSKNRDIAESG